MGSRTWWNWICRVVYTCLKFIFASVWFYFIPFSSIYLSFAAKDPVDVDG